MEKPEERSIAAEAEQADSWVAPEVKSFSPIKAAEGLSYQPGDGIYNLTP